MRVPSLPRLPLLGPALAAVAGILFAEYAAPVDTWRFAALAAVALAAAGMRAGTPALLAATAAVFAAAHGWQWSSDPARIWAGELAPEPREMRVTGVLTDEPKENPPGVYRATMRVEKWIVDGRRITLSGDMVVRWSPAETPRYGDRWDITGLVSRIPPPRNPAEFDAAGWWARQGVYLELRGNKDLPPRLLARGAGSPLRSAALSTRAWMLRTLGLGLDNAPRIRSLVAGITLGTRDAEADEFADAFRRTGTFHLFSVSGLHVGMVALLLWLVLRPFGVSRRRAVLVIIPSLFFYALITGASAPSIRSAIMLSVAFAGFLLDRPVSPANSLAVAALVLLGSDTNQLFSPGFQMSFGIVAAIFLLSPPLAKFLAARLRPDPFLPRRLYDGRQKFASDAGYALSSTLAVSAAAWLGSLPLTVAVFHNVPLLSVPANMLAVPLAFGILAVSMLALLGGLVSAWLAAIFNNTSWALASLLVTVVGGAADLPGSCLHFPPGWLQPPGRLTIFDLGDGGAQLLRTPQSAWLLDTGSESDFRRIIEPALRASGVGRLDALVVTHGDTDHMGGALAVVEAAGPRRFVDSVLDDRSRARRKFHAAIASAGLAKSLVMAGDSNRLAKNVRVQILHPEPGGGSRNADDQAIVARIEMDGFRILLMSDSGAATEDRLVRRYGQNLQSDVVVFGRHGDDITATEAFLRATRPSVIVLNRADPFRQGSDEPALRSRLARSDARIFDQETCGAVILTRNAQGLAVRGYLDRESVLLPPR